jgi:putative membrane protein
MILNSLGGLPAFAIYFVVASVLVVAYLFVYTWMTAHNEFELIRKNVPGAAIALGLSVIGFALPLTSAIGHAASVIDCTIWSIIALLVQVIVYYLVRMTVPRLSESIEKSELAPAIWLGLMSVTAGLISAASMAT